METFSVLLDICEWNPPVTGGFLSQRPVTESSDALFDLRLNKRLRIQSRRWWFETLSLWRHCNVHRLLHSPRLLAVALSVVIPYDVQELGQNWFRQWLAAWRHQAITSTNVDLPSIRSRGIHLWAISHHFSARATVPQNIFEDYTIKLTMTSAQFLWIYHLYFAF